MVITTTPKNQQPTLRVGNDVITESADIARMKKRRRILMESEDEDDD
jgi:glutathione S-transferase